MTLALWFREIALTFTLHLSVLAWVGVVLAPPCLGWLASFVLNSLRPKKRETP